MKLEEYLKSSLYLIVQQNKLKSLEMLGEKEKLIVPIRRAEIAILNAKTAFVANSFVKVL